MYFGRSIFQSVVERLESESSKTGEEAVEETTQKPAPFSSHFIGAKTLDEPDLSEHAKRQYQAFDLDDEWSATAATPEALPHISISPSATATEPQQAPEKDFIYLTASSAEEVRQELGLTKQDSAESLQAKRRKFARDNHPDRVPVEWREQATARMTAANLIIDQAVKEISLRSRLGA